MMDSYDFWSDRYNAEYERVDGFAPSRMLNRKGIDKHIALISIGRNICFKKDSGGKQPAPDPAIGEAAKANVQLGQDWLAFAKDQFAEGNKRQEITDALTSKVINQQLDTQAQTNLWGQEDRARTKNVFQPLEDGLVKTAQEFDSPEKQAEAAAAARADVQSAAATQQQTSNRQMASMGISPMSGRFAGITRAQDTNTALAAAGGENAARSMIRDKGLALRAAAADMGKGLPSSAAAAYGIGTNAGNSAVANNSSANSSFFQNGQTMNQGFAGNINANQSAGSMLNSLYGNQLNAWSAQQQASAAESGGFGQLLGSFAVAGATAF